MKATLKTIYHNSEASEIAIPFGYHCKIQAGIYPAIGFSFDSKLEALKRATANLYNLIERNEGTNNANIYFKSINLI